MNKEEIRIQKEKSIRVEKKIQAVIVMKNKIEQLRCYACGEPAVYYLKKSNSKALCRYCLGEVFILEAMDEDKFGYICELEIDGLNSKEKDIKRIECMWKLHVKKYVEKIG